MEDLSNIALDRKFPHQRFLQSRIIIPQWSQCAILPCALTWFGRLFGFAMNPVKSNKATLSKPPKIKIPPWRPEVPEMVKIFPENSPEILTWEKKRCKVWYSWVPKKRVNLYQLTWCEAPKENLWHFWEPGRWCFFRPRSVKKKSKIRPAQNKNPWRFPVTDPKITLGSVWGGLGQFGLFEWEP